MHHIRGGMCGLLTMAVGDTATAARCNAAQVGGQWPSGGPTSVAREGHAQLQLSLVCTRCTDHRGMRRASHLLSNSTAACVNGSHCSPPSPCGTMWTSNVIFPQISRWLPVECSDILLLRFGFHTGFFCALLLAGGSLRVTGCAASPNEPRVDEALAKWSSTLRPVNCSREPISDSSPSTTDVMDEKEEQTSPLASTRWP